MKPQRFEISQAVTLNKPITKFSISPSAHKLGLPRFGEIYHVSKYLYFSDQLNCWKIELLEISGLNCNEQAFDPVISIECIEDELTHIREPALLEF